MKRLRFIALSLAIIFSANFLVSCYGGFKLTGKVYKWNGSLGSKWVKTLVMWVLFIIPVYEVCAWIDWWILNTIEFWTGSNPVAMNQGDEEIKTVERDGKTYEIKATKNRFDITQLSGPDAGKTMGLVFHPEESTWYAENSNTSIKLVQCVNNNGVTNVKLFLPNDQIVSIENFDVKSVNEAKSLFNNSKDVASK